MRRALDVETDLPVGRFGLEVQHLSHDDVGDPVVDLGAEEDDAFVEQPAEDVERPLPRRCAFDDVGDRVGAHRPSPICRPAANGASSTSDPTTVSTMPYSRACSAVNHRSRSLSRSISSSECPVASERICCDCSFMYSRFSAWIAMSTAVPENPAEGWCIMIRLWARLARLPLVPAASRTCPILAANPAATVTMSLGTSCIVS